METILDYDLEFGGRKCLECNLQAVPSCCWCMTHCLEHRKESGHWPRERQNLREEKQ